MGKAYIFYNPLARNGSCEKSLSRLTPMLTDEYLICDMTEEGAYSVLSQMESDDYIIVCGGDGTLNRFANTVIPMGIQNDIMYFPSGSGNDFARDLGKRSEDLPFRINDYIHSLPTVEVKEDKRYFINGIGYGIDGYCCEEGDKVKEKSSKPVNYTTIALKGLLYAFKPRNATVTIDGVTEKYKRVWLAPAMNGRYFGGGMMATPAQKRGDGTLSLLVMHDSSRLRILLYFPGVFGGTHVKHKRHISILSGKDITVSFDRPTALQIDGDTVTGVTSYRAYVNN